MRNKIFTLLSMATTSPLDFSLVTVVSAGAILSFQFRI
jgi:hypothetical protein